MTLHKAVITYRRGEAQGTRHIFTPWSGNVLSIALQHRAPNISNVEIEAPDSALPLPQPGDTVQVEEGRFSGCVLTLVDITPGHVFVCRNDSYGERSSHYPHPVIRTRAVSFIRGKADVAATA